MFSWVWFGLGLFDEGLVVVEYFFFHFVFSQLLYLVDAGSAYSY